MLHSNLTLPKDEIADFCQRYHIRRLALFGSVLRDDFRPDSDVDVLVEFEPQHTPGLAFFDIEAELAEIMGCNVELHTPTSLSRYFRDEVPVYSMRRDDVVYLHHMLDAANRAVQYTAGRTREDLASDDLLALAAVRLIEILGEAARNVSEDIKVRHSQVPWRQVISTRNRLIHGYFDVDLDILWAIIENDLPKLVPQLEDILDER